MKFQNQSGGSAPRAIKGYGKAGCENPAHADHADVGHPHKVSMPVAAMAGSFSRKIPGPEKAGQSVAGKASHASQSFVKGRKLTESRGGKAVKV